MIDYNRFYRYNEFTVTLKALCAKHPALLQMESIGKSHEGRDIWVVTATNTATSAAADKPAYWIDANIHASELAGSTAALYYLESITKSYGQDADITRCMDTRTIYVCPRINPDGAEWAMRDTPKIIRSSTRTYPFDEPRVDVFCPCGLQMPMATGNATKPSRASWCRARRTSMAAIIIA